jgi:multidrug resistance efflux pump
MRSRARPGRIRRIRAEEDEIAIEIAPGDDRGFPALPGGRHPRRIRRMVLTVLAAVVALAIALPIALWARYQTTHVVSRNAQVKGTITHVGAQLDGVVTGVEVEAGQRVIAGQTLARFEDRQLQAAVQRAQSRLDKATRELEVERLAIVQERRLLAGRVTEAAARAAAARAQVEAAQSQADDARVKYEQRKSLAEAGAIPPEDLRSAETTLRTAEAHGATARADQRAAEVAERLAEVESEGLAVRARRVDVLEAEVAAYRAELSLAEADLKAAVIRAPADGWVVRRIAEPGASVVVGQPVVALWLGREVWVEAWIEEDDLAKVAAGNEAHVTVKPYPRRVYSGSVESIGASTDFELPDAAVPQPRNTRIRATPVICVRVRLEGSDGLFPGLSAVVGIRKRSRG